MTSQEPQALGTEFNGKSGVCKRRPFTTMTKLLLVNVFVVSFFLVFCFFNFISEDMFFWREVEAGFSMKEWMRDYCERES